MIDKGIVLREGEGADLSLADVVAFGRQRVAKSKCPPSVDFVATLPRNASGKLLKKELRKLHLPDDEHRTGARLRFRVIETEIGEIFSVGSQVAFHAKQLGHSEGGLSDLPPSSSSSRPIALSSAGIVHVAEGRIRGGRVMRDRAGLRRASAAQTT